MKKEMVFFNLVGDDLGVIERTISEEGMATFDEADLIGGVIVDELPEQVPQFGKLPRWMIKPSTGEVYIEYVDRPLTQAELNLLQEQKYAQLEAENIKLKDDMANTISAVDFILMNFQPLI